MRSYLEALKGLSGHSLNSISLSRPCRSTGASATQGDSGQRNGRGILGRVTENDCQECRHHGPSKTPMMRLHSTCKGIASERMHEVLGDESCMVWYGIILCDMVLT